MRLKYQCFDLPHPLENVHGGACLQLELGREWLHLHNESLLETYQKSIILTKASGDHQQTSLYSLLSQVLNVVMREGDAESTEE